MVRKSVSTMHSIFIRISLVLTVFSLPALLFISFVLGFTENFSPGGNRWLFLVTLIPFFLELIFLIPYVRYSRSGGVQKESFHTTNFIQTPRDTWKKIVSGLGVVLFIFNIGIIVWASVILFDAIGDRKNTNFSDYYTNPRYFQERVNAKMYWLGEGGISGDYEDITQPSDTGKRYKVAVDANTQVFIMSPDFVSRTVSGSIPTSFTSEDITFIQGVLRLSGHMPRAESGQAFTIPAVQKTEMYGMPIYWIAKYDNSDLFVQALVEDVKRVRVLLHVDVSDIDYHNNEYQAIDDVINNPIIQEILSAVSR